MYSIHMRKKIIIITVSVIIAVVLIELFFFKSRKHSLKNVEVIIQGDTTGIAAPTVSPNSNVVFTDRDGMNVEILLPSGERWRAYEGKLAERHFAWSPDGRRVAFRAEKNPDLIPRSFALLVADIKSRSVEQVSDYLPHLGRPMWRQVGNELELYAPWESDTVRRRYAIEDPLIAPVAKFILVERNGDIWLEEDGKEPRQMTLGGGVAPQISPDGTRFIYTWADAIFVANVSDTLADKRNPIASGVSPKWSPDGTKIAYCAQWDKGHEDSMEGDIFFIDMTQQNSKPVQLTYTPKEVEIELDWNGNNQLYYSVVNDGSLRRAEVK